MKTSAEPITEIDLDAYVDDQLDTDRRIEVQDYLSTHPDEAMRVMADLRVRDMLRHGEADIWDEAFWTDTDTDTEPRDATDPPPRPGADPCRGAPRTQALARRLDRARWRARLYTRLRPAAATALLFTLGWTGHVGYTAWQTGQAYTTLHQPPAFVDDAVRAHRASQIRAAMASQPDVPVLDTDEILRSLGIAMPALPPEWRIRDVQVFPSSAGPSVEILLETYADSGSPSQLSVFAARALPAAQSSVSAGREKSRAENTNVVYWQQGPWSYALTGELPELDLDHLAQRLDVAALNVH